MKRRADRAAESRAWRRAPWRARWRAPPRRRVPAITIWPGAVEVRGADHFALRRFLAGLVHAGLVEAEDRRHRAGADGHGFLHVAAAIAHQPDRIGKLQRARGHVRRVLAEAVTGDERRRAAARVEQPPHGDAHRQDRRLRVFGERQAILGPLKIRSLSGSPSAASASANVFAQTSNLIGERLAHADRLRALSGKHECDHDGPPRSAAFRS